MTRTVVLGDDHQVLTDWLERRRALGQDGHDEVWEGEYHVAPMSNSRHGDVQMQLAELLGPRARRAGLRSVGEVNAGLSKNNFRVPDLTSIRGRDHAVYLPTAAVVVEVLWPGDESYLKFGFYVERGIEEVLIVDPLGRTVEWYTRGADGFERTGASALLDLDETTLHAEIDWPPA